MSNLAQIAIDISRMPLPTVAGAYKQFNSNPRTGATKSDCVRWLADQVQAGLLTIDAVRNAKGGALPSASNAPDPAVVAKVDAAGATASAAHTAAMSAGLRIDTINTVLNSQAHKLDGLGKSIDTLTEKLGSFSLDPAVVRETVAKAVADEFAPFKQAVHDAKAEAVVASMSSVHIVETKLCEDVFGVEVQDRKGNLMTVSIWNDPTAPAIDPDFIWTEEILLHLLLSDTTGENVWFGGEKGTGKSETARQFAARTGRGFKRINFHKHTTVEEYLGATGLKGGDTVFEPRDFLTAYTSPSTVILLDEITNADAGELAPLNGFLEPNAAVSFGGQVWRKAQGVMVFAADNTFGSGDDTGRYAGTRTQNVALVDRFSRVIPFTFLEQDYEIDAIVKRTGCTRNLAKIVHAAIRVARQKVEQAEIVDAPSIRSVMAFIRALPVLSPKLAWETTIVARQPSESHATLRGIYEVYIDTDELHNNL
jgi:MoxR-like ATPase